MTIERKGRQTVMIKLDRPIYTRLRAILYVTGRDRTIQSLCHEAIRRMVQDIEATENEGKPFKGPEVPAADPLRQRRKK